MNPQSDILPDPSGSLLRRLRFTPFTDLLRGRVSARLDTERLIALSGVPSELAALVRHVSKRTRLWKTEKAEVAEELIAHFRDSLDRGVAPADVVRNFGDPPIAARLIRRAKRRSRPLPIRAVVWAIHGAGYLMLACIVAYAFFAIRMHTGKVVIRRHYVAEYNAPILAMKEEEKAWPLYKQAFLASGATPQGLWRDSLNPVNEHWPKWAEYVAANQEAIRLYRLGASRPRCGKLLSDADEQETIAHRKARGEPTDFYSTRTPSEDPALFRVLLPETSILREGARLLTVDSYQAAIEGDRERLSSDLTTMLSMAEHMAEGPMLLSGLCALSIMGNCEAVIQTVLARYPSVLSDEALRRLSHKLAVCINLGRLRMPLDKEWALTDDLIQRSFSDDGNDGGCLASTELIDELSRWSSDAKQPRADALFLPIRSGLHAGRRALAGQCTAIRSLVEQEDATPLWCRTHLKAESMVRKLEDGAWAQMQYDPLSWIIPSYSRASYLHEIATQVRDATLVAMALELYHRRLGKYPASLDDLVPDYLPSVPLDRYDGQPIKYRLVNSKPILYSVGVDRDDDGARLPKNVNKSKAHRDAREWLPPEFVKSSNPSDRAHVPDGDWILWPPVDQESN